MATFNGSKNANVLVGTSGADVIRGRGGNDTIIGGAGDDTLKGGGGADRLEVGLGSDIVDGGRGADVVVFSGNRDDYQIIDMGDGSVRVIGPDGDNLISTVELFEFADLTQTYAELLVPRLPNLTAGAISVEDASPAPGEEGTFNFDLISNGDSDADETTFQLVVATSPDEASIISAYLGQSAPAVASGEAVNLSATLPADALAPGSYWVAIRVDSSDALEEVDETDNLTDWVQIVVEAPVTDLVLDAAVATESDLDLGLGGGEVIVDYTITNTGNTGSDAYRLISVLSRDGTISADDITLADTTGQVGLGQTVMGSLTGAVDETIGDGEWQVLTTLEWTGGEVDATPENNVVAETVVLTPAVADLQLSAATLGPDTDLDLAGGGQLQMTYDWANTGTTTPSYFSIRSYLSTDLDVSEDDLPVLGITGGTFIGQTSVITTNYYLSEAFAAGDYYLISEISWGDGTDDPTDDNRIVQQVTLVAPDVDLAVANLSIDTASDLLLDEDGARILGSVDISNLGDIAASSQLVGWLSVDGIVSADDVQIDLGSVTVDQAGTETVLIDQLFSYGLSAGDYTLIVELAETDDLIANNSATASITFDAPPPPTSIDGTEGDDFLVGTANGEVINGFGGNDVIVVSGGSDTVDGGEGIDLIDFSAAQEGIILAVDSLAPDLIVSFDQSYVEQDNFRNFEAIVGSGFDDYISALYYETALFIDVGAGNDIVGGSEYDDVVSLGSGIDIFGAERGFADGVSFGDGHDRILDFNVFEDVIFFQLANEVEFDPLADVTQTSEGALISYAEGASILLEGVDVFDLNESNVMVDTTLVSAGFA